MNEKLGTDRELDSHIRAEAEKAAAAGIAPIDCPAIARALETDAWFTIGLICEVWGVTGGKYK